jgi:hypothetical protein
MIRVDFLISNPGHHAAMMSAIIAQLDARSARCRVLSLCELRGFDTPAGSIAAAGAEVVKLFPAGIRKSASSGRQRRSAFARTLREGARSLAWSLQIAPRLKAAWAEPPHVVVVPNDAAFPYDRLATACARRGLPLVLVQEGIRFPLPAEAGRDTYGLGGAAAIAVWGEASADFFRQRGIEDERIFVTGNPRFDEARPRERTTDAQPVVDSRHFESRSDSRDHLVEGPHLLLATNPIDDQGFCTTREKMELFDRFLTAVEPLIANDGVTLLVRRHGRESGKDYEALLSRRPWGDRVIRANDGTLNQFLEVSSAVVILASTVGLEALAAGRPLGVLEIPGWGHVFDYVREGAATAVSWDDDPTMSLRSLLRDGVVADEERRFLERHLGPRSGAAEAIADLIRSTVSTA